MVRRSLTTRARAACRLALKFMDRQPSEPWRTGTFCLQFKAHHQRGARPYRARWTGPSLGEGRGGRPFTTTELIDQSHAPLRVIYAANAPQRAPEQVCKGTNAA